MTVYLLGSYVLHVEFEDLTAYRLAIPTNYGQKYLRSFRLYLNLTSHPCCMGLLFVSYNCDMLAEVVKNIYCKFKLVYCLIQCIVAKIA